jgi:hypothetical protein
MDLFSVLCLRSEWPNWDMGAVKRSWQRVWKVIQMPLDQYQSSVLAFLFGRLPIGEDADTLAFALAGDFGGKFNAVHSDITDRSRGKNRVYVSAIFHKRLFGLSL